MGRPSLFTEELSAEICRLTADGMGMHLICAREGMPCHSTVMDWMARGHSGEAPFAIFLDNLLLARDRRHDGMIERCASEFLPDALAIADGLKPVMASDDLPDYVNPSDVDVQRDRLRVEARYKAIDSTLKLLAQMNPKKYGTKVTQEHTGANGGPIQTIDLTLTPQEAKDLSQALDDEC